MTRGRPNRYAVYDDLLEKYPPKSMSKRPVYVNGIGLFRGQSRDSVFIQIHLRHGGLYDGKRYQAGHRLEIPLGSLSSWDWHTLENEKLRLQGLADRGEPLQEDIAPLFKVYAEEWLELAKTRQKSLLTSKVTISKSLLPAFGEKYLSDISVREVNQWQAERLKTVKSSTVQREKNCLKAIINSAIREGLITSNVCLISNKLPTSEARLRYWENDELKAIINATKADELFNSYILWALNSAMRRSEILRLRWNDVVKLNNGRTIILISQSKSGKPRQLPCSEAMLEILKTRKAVAPNCDTIFPISKEMLVRRMTKLRRHTGIEDIRLHDLRTMNITYSLMAGVDAKTLTGITGHKDLQMIQKHYSVVRNEALLMASQSTGAYIANILKDKNTS